MVCSHSPMRSPAAEDLTCCGRLTLASSHVSTQPLTHSLLVSWKGPEIGWQWISLPQVESALPIKRDVGSEKDKLKHCPILPVSAQCLACPLGLCWSAQCCPVGLSSWIQPRVGLAKPSTATLGTAKCF